MRNNKRFPQVIAAVLFLALLCLAVCSPAIFAVDSASITDARTGDTNDSASIVGIHIGGANTDGKEDDGARRNVCRIRMTYPVYEGISDITDLDKIETAVNEIAAEKIGVEVELIPVDMDETEEKYLLWLSRGDILDLMLVRDQDITSYIDKGLLNPLNVYLKRNASYVYFRDEMLNGALTERTQQQGKTYGISNIPAEDAYGYGLWISAAVLDEAGIEYEEEHVYSLEEIDEALAKLKRLYPDSYPLGQITARKTHSTVSSYLEIGDALGADLLTGVVRNDSDVVENIFASEEYYEFLSYMKKWYDAGYIYPESVTYDASVLPLLEEKVILSFPAGSYPGTYDLIVGEETDYVCLRTTQVRKNDANMTADFWTVPSTSRYPEAAVQFLDLCFSDLRIAYLLNYGISGEHYEIYDMENQLAAPVLDIDGNSSGFYNPFARIGSNKSLCAMGTKENKEKGRVYCEQALESSGRYDGFVYSTADMSGKMDAVRKVIATYAPILESGSVNLDVNYQNFLAELDEAGIGAIIADKQEQLDAWLKRQQDRQ